MPPKGTICTCLKCGVRFAVKRSDSAGKYCSKRCNDSVNKNPPPQPWTPLPCAYCGETFLRAPWNSAIQCCSNKCGKRLRARTVVGENHPLYKPKVPMACEVCGTIRMVKPSLVYRFRSCSRQCNAALSQRTFPRVSSIERAMAVAFSAIGLRPVPQRAIGPYVVDFAFPDAMIVVETDGTYWHGRESQQTKDRQKDGYLRSQGWEVIRLTEERIKADAVQCAREVAAMLHVDPAFLRSPEPPQLSLLDSHRPTSRSE